MTPFGQTLFRVKKFLTKVPLYLKPGSLPVTDTEAIMSRKIEDNDSDIPCKKFCSEGKNDETTNKNQSVKIKKKNIALLLGYCGANYWGMQINGDVKTVEGELLSALQKSDFIPAEALKDPHSIHFQRAARTDKGVSAAKQVVSFKIAENYNVDTINNHLPKDIKVFSIKRVTKGFNCKNDCMARTYSYTLPSFALAPELHEEYPQNYRITEEAIKKANEILMSFIGTHCFHNFTSKKHSKDPSAKRYIMTINTEEPFIDGEEFITITVKGQSFMLHQIRKMVGHTISIIKSLAPPNLETEVWKDEKYSIPMAPGLGLVLENLHYDAYNRKFGNDGIHETLTWDEIAEEIKEFRKKNILPKIIKREKEEKLMFNWILELRERTYKFSTEKDLKEDGVEETSREKINADKLIIENTV